MSDSSKASEKPVIGSCERRPMKGSCVRRCIRRKVAAREHELNQQMISTSNAIDTMGGAHQDLLTAREIWQFKRREIQRRGWIIGARYQNRNSQY
jgi:hypothetical protein